MIRSIKNTMKSGDTVNCTFEKLSETTIVLIFEGRPFECSTEILYPHQKQDFIVKSVERTPKGACVIWEQEDFGTLQQEYRFDVRSDSDFYVEYDFRIRPHQNTEAVIIQNLAFWPEEEPYFMIPGSLYGTNNLKNSKSNQPQLNYRGDVKYPKTPVLFTRADRSTHNAVIAVAGNQVAGIRIDESIWNNNTPFYNGLGIDTRNDDGRDRIAVTIGYRHFPVRYIGKLPPGHAFTEGAEYGWIPFENGASYETKGHLYIGSAENKFAYEKVVSSFYESIHQPPGNPVSRYDAIKDIGGALVKDAYHTQYKYFPVILSGSFADTLTEGDAAWTGGMQVVYPLVRAVPWLPEAKEVAVDYIEDLVYNGVNSDSGFFNECKYQDEWKVSGWWKNDLLLYNRRLEKIEEAHSAYVNGQAACYLLKSYRFAKEQGWECTSLEDWLKVCRSIVDKVIAQQRYDGALGVYFDPANGEAIYYNSFQGAWFLASIAEMAAVTGEKKYLDAFMKANKFYYSFLERVELWGMPMDTRDAVDEEGNLAYITALKTMHELTGDKVLLEELVHALHYEFSWKFAYNTRHVNEPLKSLNWASSGGSITSSHNIHIHQMGNLVVEEMYYTYQQTGDEYILSRLKDTLNWGLGTYNLEDGYMGFGKKGWATEQFFHSDGKQDDPNRIVDGGIWYDYLTWAAACVLLSSASDIPDEYFLP